MIFDILKRLESVFCEPWYIEHQGRIVLSSTFDEGQTPQTIFERGNARIVKKKVKNSIVGSSEFPAEFSDRPDLVILASRLYAHGSRSDNLHSIISSKLIAPRIPFVRLTMTPGSISPEYEGDGVFDLPMNWNLADRRNLAIEVSSFVYGISRLKTLCK